MNAALFLLVGAAGGIGAALRYALDHVLTFAMASASAPAEESATDPVATSDRPSRQDGAHNGRFPIGTLVVNITGSFALGLLTGLGTAVMSEVALIVGVGLLGGYTTFSTVHVETVLLAERRQWLKAAVNLIGTVVLAVLMAALGLSLGARIVGLTAA